MISDLWITLVICSSAWPMFRLWQGTMDTTLRPAVYWAIVAWCCWGGLTVIDTPLWNYVTLTMTGCVGVAILGARRPGAEVWNFVVFSLLAVLLLPIAQNGGNAPTSSVALGFLAVILGMGILNYLPTRCALPTLLIAIGCALVLFKVNERPDIALCLVSAGLWLGWWIMRHGPEATIAINRRWLNFRDQFGVVWGQRAREQFIRAAENQQILIELHWTGIAEDQQYDSEMLIKADQLLAATLKRFFKEDAHS